MNIKRQLIAEIEKIEDQDVLNQLSELVSISIDSIGLEFTNDQISVIEESQNQIKSGACKSHDEVMKNLDND